MASFEQKDLVDYAVKKIEDVVNEVNRDYMREHLDKLWIKTRRVEDEVRKIVLRLENLDNRVRLLEESSSSEE